MPGEEEEEEPSAPPDQQPQFPRKEKRGGVRERRGGGGEKLRRRRPRGGDNFGFKPGGCLHKDSVETAFKLADRADEVLINACWRIGKLLGLKQRPRSKKRRTHGYWDSPFVQFFWVFVVCSSIVTTFYAFPSFYARKNETTMRTLSQALHLYHMFMIVGNYLIMRKVASMNFVTDAMQGNLESSGSSLCSRCQRIRPVRSHHCRYCKRCILKRGHHCFFSETCIGLHNQRHFCSLILHQLLGIWRQNWVLLYTRPELRANPFSLLWYLYFVSSVFSGIFIFTLFVRQWGSMLLGATETEMSRTTLVMAWSTLDQRQWGFGEMKPVFGRLGFVHLLLPLEGGLIVTEGEAAPQPAIAGLGSTQIETA